MPSLDYLAHLERESARFAAALLAAPPDGSVPTCPDWTADDLLWHLAEVQWFWGEIVRSRATEPDTIEAGKPGRPADRDGLLAFYRVASGGLLAALAAAGPADPVWTWSDDHTVGFVRRRQAHEALVHRVDAELAAGERTPMDPLLSADGVDEALDVMHGGLPAWGTFTPHTDAPVRVATTDTAHAWLVTPGRFAGTDPESGQSWDTPALEPAATGWSGPIAATVSAAAADLDCLVWNRPPVGPVSRDGDPAALAAFAEVLEGGIQ